MKSEHDGRQQEPCDGTVLDPTVLSRRCFMQLAIMAGASVAGTVMLGGCSSSTSTTSSGAKIADTVIDAKGDEFTIPDKVEKIVITCQGGTTHEVAIFGGADKIKAQPSMKAFKQLLKMYPQFNDIADGGSFNNVNIETLAAQEPDVALVGVSSDKGNSQIRDIGIPTYVMLIGWAAIDTLKQEFLNVGKIVGGEQKAQDLVAHWDKTLSSLEDKAANIPASARKKVYYLSKADITKASSSSSWGHTWITEIGANDAVPTSDANGEITVEKALGWDPDIIVVQGGSNIDDLLNNEQLQDMKAIKNKQVYSCPIGAFWWDRPSPEATLGFMWLAKTVYPDYMEDIDLKSETFSFYKEFYGYSLSDSEYDSFF